jgi:hypothetical protein
MIIQVNIKKRKRKGDNGKDRKGYGEGKERKKG